MDKCSNCYIIDRAKLSYCPDCKKVKKTSQDVPTIDILDKIRAKILRYRDTIDRAIAEDSSKIEGMKEAYNDCLEIIDEYMAERDK